MLALSGGLSGTVNAARLAKDICGYENVWVVDTRQAIITQRMLVEHAVSLRKKGMSAAEIAADIESVKDRLVVCGVLDTLTNLRKGGRIPPTFDVIGNALKIKPVIELKDGELVKIGIARGARKAKEFLWKEYDACEIDTDWPVYTGYTYDKEHGEMFRKETQERCHLKECKMVAVGRGYRDPCGKELSGACICKKIRNSKDHGERIFRNSMVFFCLIDRNEIV